MTDSHTRSLSNKSSDGIANSVKGMISLKNSGESCFSLITWELWKAMGFGRLLAHCWRITHRYGIVWMTQASIPTYVSDMSTLTLYGCLEVVLTVSFPKLTVYPSPPFVRAMHRHPLNIFQRKSTRLTSHCESRRPRTTLSSPPRSVINCKDCQAGTAGGKCGQE